MSDYFYNLKMRRPSQKMMQKLEPITYYRNYLDCIKKKFNGKTPKNLMAKHELKKMKKIICNKTKGHYKKELSSQ